MLVDMLRVRYWMNARKMTSKELAVRAGVAVAELESLLGHDDLELPDDLVGRLSKVFDIAPGQLSAAGHRELTAVTMTAEETQETRRSIYRDGILFYNYYTLAAPTGRVAPVILDILCPPDRLPTLNNGHLEPAITVNLGPGDIRGRWGVELTDATWQILRANRDEDGWITGDSYVEPTYCPHSYARAGEQPARIISYTCESPLAPLVSDLNSWSTPAFEAFLAAIDGGGAGPLLRLLLDRRCHDADHADRVAGLPTGTVRGVLEGERALDPAQARALGQALAFDYRVLLAASHDHDAVGKTCLSIEESRRSVRRFRGYQVASLATASHLSDLVGAFMLVERPDEEWDLDLCDHGETHYLVRSGEVQLWWRDRDCAVRQARVGPDGSAWLGPFVEHGWSGSGAVVRLGSGRHVSYHDLVELSNTFAVGGTLSRSRRDRLGWGYDGGGEESN